MTGRRALAIVADDPIPGATIILTPPDWQSHFDPETWIERWYRAGHRIMAAPDGRPVSVQNMDADETYAKELRAELGWCDNAHRLRAYLASFQPTMSNTYSAYAWRSS